MLWRNFKFVSFPSIKRGSFDSRFLPFPKKNNQCVFVSLCFLFSVFRVGIAIVTYIHSLTLLQVMMFFKFFMFSGVSLVLSPHFTPHTHTFRNRNTPHTHTQCSTCHIRCHATHEAACVAPHNMHEHTTPNAPTPHHTQHA